MIDETQWFELREAANALHICTRQLFRYRRLYGLPSTKVGRTVYLSGYCVGLVEREMRPCGRPPGRLHRAMPEWHKRLMLESFVRWIESITAHLSGYDHRGLRTTKQTAERFHTHYRRLRTIYLQMLPIIEDATTYADFIHLADAVLLGSDLDARQKGLVLELCFAMIVCDDPDVAAWEETMLDRAQPWRPRLRADIARIFASS